MRESFLPRCFFLFPSSSCIYMVSRPVNINKFLGRGFSVKKFSKKLPLKYGAWVTKKMVSRTSKTPIPKFWKRYSWIKINSTVELACKNGKAKTSRSTWNVLLTKIQFSIVLVICNYLHTWYMMITFLY